MSWTKPRHRAAHFTAGAAFAALLVTAVAATPRNASAASERVSGFTRHTITQKVSLTGSGPADQTVSAVEYRPTHARVKGPQVMIPGVTYDHRYFDLKTDRGWISQAREAAEDGWITVAVDRLGTGNSSSPAADKLNGTTHAATIHQLITTLKTAHKGLPVALVGHSMGSTVAVQEAATYKDVDAAAVTALAAAAVAGGAAFTAPASAAAQGAYAAEYNGACGSGYSVVHGRDIGDLGTVYLTWNERIGENCAVTVRARKGAAVYMQAKVYQTNHTQVSSSDSGAYTTYAGPVHIPARGERATVRGQIADT